MPWLRRHLLPLTLITALATAAACSDDGGSSAPEPGSDAGQDVAIGDASPDTAGEDATHDAPPDDVDGAADARDAAGDADPVDADEADGGNDADAGADAAADVDADAADPVPTEGFGQLDGECGVLDEEEWASDEPFRFQNSIDFGDDPWDEADLPLLTEGGQEVFTDGNAGGSSLLSEVFAFEVLQRCEQATLLKTETEVVYTDPDSKITDLLVSIDGRKVGVSVTRAVGFPRDDPYTVDQARMLLERKLADILDSSASVAEEDRWVRQILHVVAYAPGHADSMAQALGQIDPSVKADTIVIVTVSEGMDEFLY